MPAVQNSYTERHAVAQLGMIADTRFKSVRSLTYTGADVLGFGIALTRGADDKSADFGGAVFAGIVVSTQVQDAALATDGYASGESVGLLDIGSIWVAPAAAVVAGDPVTFDAATGALSNTGGITIVGAEYETNANAGDLARIRMK